MRKVLITGGSGFIGRYVVEETIAAGYTPVVFDRRRERAGQYPEGTEIFLGDTCDETAVTQAMAHVDGWIHLAAVLGTQETIRNPRPAVASNVMGSLNVLEAAAEYDLPGVYICVGNHWMNNTYSISKTSVERFIRMYNAERGTRVNMVRAVNAYGPGQVPAAPYGPAKVRKITPAFVCRALCGVPIEIYGDGRQISDMVYVTDVARSLVRALEKADRGEVFDRAVEIGPAEHHTVLSVAELVNTLASEHTGSLVDIVHLPMRPGEVPGDRVTADVDTLALVGMDPDGLVRLHEGMSRTVEHFARQAGRSWWRPETAGADAARHIVRNVALQGAVDG